MDEEELLNYLYNNIPVTAAMEVGVVEIAPKSVTLSAPLGPNTNHRNTAFGGSVSTLATLAAWSLLRIRLGDDLAKKTHLVIQRNSVEYFKPIEGAFSATATFSDGADWERFTQVFAARGRARISIEASVNFENQECARFVGDFVALAT